MMLLLLQTYVPAANSPKYLKDCSGANYEKKKELRTIFGLNEHDNPLLKLLYRFLHVSKFQL